MEIEQNIVLVSVEKIIPYENNPRYNEDAVRYVVESIDRFGFRNPVHLDKNNVIICGHTRYFAAKEKGMEYIPCIYDSDLTEEEAAAYRLADNKVSEFSFWNKSLHDELEKISGIDMSLFGFETFDMELDVSDHDFITDTETTASRKKTIVCPHCHKEFEV